MGRWPSAQEGALSTSEYGGEVPRLEAGCPMPNPIDAAMYPEERPPSYAISHLFRCDAGARELRPGNNAMTGTRDPRQNVVNHRAPLFHWNS
jgi:hypothetical protein